MKKILLTFLIALTLFASGSGYANAAGVSAGNISNFNGPPAPTSTLGAGVTTGLNFVTGGVYGQVSDAAASAKAAAEAVNSMSSALDCLKNPVNCFQKIFYDLISRLGNIILSVVSWLLWFAGIIFNFAVIVLVVHMKDVLNGIPVIFTVWTVLRDFANMFFIFILLYIAISTILGASGWKKMLTNVVLVALFLNFSFFVTGALIDASNIVALQFFNGFAGTGCKGAYTGDLEKADGCMSYKIVSALKLQSIYDIKNVDGVNTTGQNLNGGTGVNNGGQNQAAALTIPGSPLADSNIQKFIISVIAGSILMIITAGIFIASAILIFYRFIELLVLMMVSPIAFAFIVIPSTKGYWNEWWNRLVKNLISIPAYFMFLWICMMVISSGNLIPVLGATGTFQSAFSVGSDPKGVFALLANYIIIIMLLGYSLVLAQKLGAAGAKQATAAAKSVQSFVGKNTVGRAASRVANSETMKNWAASSSVGRLAQKPFTSLASASFGDAKSKGGFDKAEKDYIKKQEDFAKTLGPTALQSKRAKDAQSTAKSNLTLQSGVITKNINDKFAPKEKESADNIKVAEAKKAELVAKAEDLKTLVSTHSSSDALSAVEKKQQRDDAAAAEKALADHDKVLDSLKKQDEDIKKQKENELRAQLKVHEDELKRADKVAGVDDKEAKARAEAAGLKGDEAKDYVANLLSNNKGITKERQGAFIKQEEGRWFLGPNKKAAVSDTVRKLMNGKSKADQLLEDIEKKVKEDAKNEKGGAGGGDDEKPKDDGGKKDKK